METSTSYKTLTREQFLFSEMRITARLMMQGLSDKEIIQEIEKDNLYQYPTDKMIRNITSVCLKRLHTVNVNIKFTNSTNIKVTSLTNVYTPSSDESLSSLVRSFVR